MRYKRISPKRNLRSRTNERGIRQQWRHYSYGARDLGEGIYLLVRSMVTLPAATALLTMKGITAPADSPYVSNESELPYILRVREYYKRLSAAPFASPCTDITLTEIV
jgi:hypothetical protein